MQKIGTIKALFYCLFIFICSSCTDLLSEEDTPVNITDEFRIDMFQSLNQTDFELVIEMSTTEEFDCTNYIISTTQSKDRNIFNVELNDILEPEVCQEGSGSASAQINFIEQDIDQKIRFFFTDQVYDEAGLSMNSSTVELDVNSTNGIKSYIKQLTRIPVFTITCLFEYNDIEEELIVQDKINALTQILQPTELQDGYYGHFEVEDNTVNAKDNEFTYSRGAHFDLSSVSEIELEDFENQLNEIQESLNDENLKIELIRTF